MLPAALPIRLLESVRGAALRSQWICTNSCLLSLRRFSGSAALQRCRETLTSAEEVSTPVGALGVSSYSRRCFSTDPTVSISASSQGMGPDTSEISRLAKADSLREAERVFFDTYAHPELSTPRADQNVQEMSLHAADILDARVNKMDPELEDAENFLRKMVRLGLSVDTKLLNIVLKGWAKVVNPERAQELMATFLWMADWESYAHELHAWSGKGKSSEAPSRAKVLIVDMENKFGQKTVPAVCYLFALDCWAASNRATAVEYCQYLTERLKPLLREEKPTETAKLHAFGLSRADFLIRTAENSLQIYSKEGDAHTSEKILLEFIDDYVSGRHDAPPSVAGMYIPVFAAWVRSKSSRRAARAERLLARLEGKAASSKGSLREIPAPDVICYSLCINAHAKSDKPTAGQNAESLLLRMPMKPNVRSFTSVLAAWSRSENKGDIAVHGGERTWSAMTKALRESYDEEPDDWAICSMITLWGRSNRKDAMERAETYFSLLKRSSAVEPTTALIQAWSKHASKRGPEAVLRVAELLEKLEDRPNSRTFAAIFHTIAAARGVSDRDKLASRYLRKMNESGIKTTKYVSNIAERCYGEPSQPKKGGKNKQNR